MASEGRKGASMIYVQPLHLSTDECQGFSGCQPLCKGRLSFFSPSSHCKGYMQPVWWPIHGVKGQKSIVYNLYIPCMTNDAHLPSCPCCMGAWIICVAAELAGVLYNTFH